MKRTVQALFDGEVLRPRDQLDLEPDRLYLVTIEEQLPLRSPGPGVLDDLVALGADLDLPTDLAEQHDHYLYGTPKR